MDQELEVPTYHFSSRRARLYWGKNILVEYRYVEGKPDRIPGLVTEFVQLKVDVVVTGLFPAILAAKQATKAIPIDW